MKALQTRVRRLEGRSGPTAPLPWEMAGWEWLSKADQLLEAKQYVAVYPDSALARRFRAIKALSDVELDALIVTLHAQEGATP